MDATPMFPLGTVLLPSVLLPLHVFEPRYRTLVHDCLAADATFGVVLIERGSEVGGGDVRTDVGTLARIVHAEELPDGRWGLLAVGERRIRVQRWLDDDPYPRAVVGEWQDPPAPDGVRGDVDSLVTVLRRVLALRAELGDAVARATLDLADDPAAAVFQAAAASPLGPADLQRLLEAPDLAARVVLARSLLDDEEAVARARLAGGQAPDAGPGPP